MSMRDRIKKSVNRTNEKFALQKAELLLNTELNLAELSPNITSHELYSQLVGIIEKSTSNNWKVAKLESAINDLGEEAWQLVSSIISTLK